VYSDRMSGAKENRPGLNSLIELEEMEARLLANPGATLADVYTPTELAEIEARVSEARKQIEYEQRRGESL
jgi:hypothetical protein